MRQGKLVSAIFKAWGLILQELLEKRNMSLGENLKPHLGESLRVY